MVSRVAAESADETERGPGAWRVEGTGTLIRAVGLLVTHSLSWAEWGGFKRGWRRETGAGICRPLLEGFHSKGEKEM